MSLNTCLFCSSLVGGRSRGTGAPPRASALLRCRVCNCRKNILQLDDGHAEQPHQAGIKRIGARCTHMERVSEAGRITIFDRYFSQRE